VVWLSGGSGCSYSTFDILEDMMNSLRRFAVLDAAFKFSVRKVWLKQGRVESAITIS
jgi:hypothetical protein